MTIRELSSDQINDLHTDSKKMLETRQNGWKNATPKQEAIYQTGYSDGVRAALKLIKQPR